MNTLIRNINKLPYPTWNWLKLNSADLSLELPYDKPARSDSVKIVNNNENVTVKTSFYTTEITSSAKETGPLLLHFDLEDKVWYKHEQIIRAKENSELTVIMDYSSLPEADGFSQIKTKVIAEPYSKIRLVKVQLLGREYTQIDNTHFDIADGADVDFIQIELGADISFCEAKTDLNGYRSKFTAETAFIANKQRLVDMNYVVNLIAPETETKMTVKGAVTSSSKKVYRGTMNFKNGCHGAKGEETEETLLLSEEAVNKSIPMILCDEENVQGSHGATLGRLGEDELFYMESRGIGAEEAKRMMMNAKISSTASLIPDEDLRKRIEGYIEN